MIYLCIGVAVFLCIIKKLNKPATETNDTKMKLLIH